jgi:hypothetical protein
MTTIIKPLTLCDLSAIQVQAGQRGEVSGMDPAMLLAGPAWCARGHDGRLLACGGFAPVHPGHFYAWAHLADGKGHGLVPITRHARAWLAGGHYRRVTAYARADWVEACRWIDLLGFHAEGLLRAFGPDGEDYVVFGRTRGI